MRLFEDWAGRWRPGIGDPHFMGWFTAGSYVACAVMAALLATFLNQMEEKRDGSFWFLIALLMVFFGINKQLDLQSLFAEMGRQIAIAQGWYPHRRIAQFSFIVIFATTLIGAFLWFAGAYRDLLRRYPFASCGLLLLIGFVVIRAAAFHHFDEVIQYDLHGIKVNWVFELSGIYMIMMEVMREFYVSWVRKG
jgi:hypothetical protein